MRHKLLVLTVKNFLQSVYIYGSYRKIKTGVPFFFGPPGIYMRAASFRHSLMSVDADVCLSFCRPIYVCMPMYACMSASLRLSQKLMEIACCFPLGAYRKVPKGIESNGHDTDDVTRPWVCPGATAAFAKIFNGLLFRSILWMCTALSIPDRGTKNWAVPEYADAPFSPKFLMGFVFGCTLWMYRPNLQSVALPVPEIIAIALLGWGCEPPILEKGWPLALAVWIGNGTVWKSVGEFL